jgi:hypothetical protein
VQVPVEASPLIVDTWRPGPEVPSEILRGWVKKARAAQAEPTPKPDGNAAAEGLVLEPGAWLNGPGSSDPVSGLCGCRRRRPGTEAVRLSRGAIFPQWCSRAEECGRSRSDGASGGEAGPFLIWASLGRLVIDGIRCVEFNPTSPYPGCVVRAVKVIFHRWFNDGAT